MKRKLFFVLVLLAAFSTLASAQLTTGTPSAKTVRTGNRPEAGDFGLYLAPTIRAFDGSVTGFQKGVIPFPVLNFKYFATDRFEIRASVDAFTANERYLGNILSTTGKTGSAEAEFQYLLEPGIAYHFTKKNILDVYAGAELLLGVSGEKAVTVDEPASLIEKVTKSAFTTGISAFVGLQIFVANLPIALGVEYGLSSQLDLGLKYKNYIKSGSIEQTFYTTNLDSSYSSFEKLGANRGAIGQQVRLTLSYYFK